MTGEPLIHTSAITRHLHKHCQFKRWAGVVPTAQGWLTAAEIFAHLHFFFSVVCEKQDFKTRNTKAAGWTPKLSLGVIRSDGEKGAPPILNVWLLAGEEPPHLWGSEVILHSQSMARCHTTAPTAGSRHPLLCDVLEGSVGIWGKIMG